MRNKILFILTAAILACIGGNALAYGSGLDKVSTIVPYAFTSVMFAASFLPAVKGQCRITFGAMEWDNPVDNAAGCEVIAYFAPTSDIETFPILSKLTGELVGPIEMKTGKTFLPIFGVVDSVKVESKLQGETLTKSFKPTGSLKYPQWSRKTTDFGRIAKNGNFIVIFIDNNGERKVVGSMTQPAVIDKLDYSTGDKGTSGTEMTLEVSQGVCNAPAGYYTGAIPIASGTLPAQTAVA